jgi:pilus assembly protein CpaB
MNVRTLVTLAVAILLGVVAVFGVRAYLSAPHGGPAAQASAPTQFVDVVVAAKAIDRGVVLSPDLLKVVHYPADGAPQGAFQNAAQLTGPGQTGRIATRAMALNEAVLDSKVTAPDGKLTLATSVLPGMRAVALRSSDVAGVAGFVLPGDRIDILLTRSVGGGDAAQTVTQVLAQNILVMGVDQSSDDSSNKPVVARAVTVQVTPEQAEAISLGQAVGQVSLALRHVADDAPLTRVAVTVGDLGYGPRRAPAPRPRPPAPRPHGESSGVIVTRGVEATGYPVGL